MGAVGVLALQGGFRPHVEMLERLGHRAVEVRAAAELREVDGLVLPGGESTAQLKLIGRHGLEGPLRDLVASGRPVLATCAGLILAARTVRQPEQWSFGWVDVAVARNGYGRQVDSFEAEGDGPFEGGAPLRMVFIRAPRIEAVGAVEVLARQAGEPVLVRSRNVWAASFHPELAGEDRLHRRVFGENRA
jgi:5'-phosphate synthase pdxT subunit